MQLKSLAGANNTESYDNSDLKTDTSITLKELLGDDFEKYEAAPGAMGKQEFIVGDIYAPN